MTKIAIQINKIAFMSDMIKIVTNWEKHHTKKIDIFCGGGGGAFKKKKKGGGGGRG